MKKVLALLLVVAMLIPAGLSIPAKAEEVQKKPFYVLSWSSMDETKYPYLNEFVTATWTTVGENANLAIGGAGMRYGSYTDADVTAVANVLKSRLEVRPEGSRIVHLFGPARLYSLAPESAVYMDFAVNQMTAMMEDLFKKMSEINCPLDGVVIDTEYIGMGTYYMIDTDSNYPNYIDNPKLLQQIVKDKRYKTELRPLLEEYGFVFYDAGDPAKQAAYTELYSLTKNAGSKYEISRSIWGVISRVWLNHYNDIWLYEPLRKYYPDASCSDYQSTDSKSWLKLSTVTDDGVVLTGGNGKKVGDTSTNSFYYTRPNASDFKNLNKVSGFNDAYYVAEPFTGLLYDVNYARFMYESTDTHKISPWTSSYNYAYTGDKRASVALTPYYTELIYHLGMFNPQPFLHYNTRSEVGGEEGWDNASHILNDIITSLNNLAGYADNAPVSMPLNWNSKFILTGMYSGGRNLWRITPNESIVSRSEFLVSNVELGEDPTFYINGQTVTFPGGKILEEAPIKNAAGEEIGSVGYWVETAKDVNPVITSDEDRYEAFPSLQYDFENYEYGAFDYNTSQPTNGWGFTWSNTSGGVKGASTITTVDGNKMLSIIGNSKNFLKTLPSNITAGDSYAEDQAWEITVTIPKNLSKDAKITLLNYEGKKQEVADGGFMIQNGKLYYGSNQDDEAGAPVYQELMDVKEDTTYTFIRYMDFNDKDVFYSTYVVKSGNGRTLKTLEDVPVPVFETIETIGFGVAEADKAVLVDDFKLYLTGTTTDFYLYDAEIGYAVDLDTTRDRSTAYRLSWLNATSEEETATIKADITEGGKTTTTVIQEITMKPGNDSVATGIVEIKEGQTVKVYLESSLKPVAAEDEAGPLVDATFTEGGIQTVPSALKELGLDSVDKIKEALEGKIKETNAETVGINHYAVAVNKSDIPRHGKMTVIMPYPAGTNANYTFYAAQLYTADAYGKKAGDVGVMEAINTAEGIQFTVFGTSPIAIGWVAPAAAEALDATAATRTPDQLERPVGTRITRPTEAPAEDEYDEPTEETEYIEPTEETLAPTEETLAPETTAPVVEDEGGVNIVLIIVIAAVVLAGAGAAVFFLLKKKKAAVPAAEEIEEIEEPAQTEEKTEE